MPQTVRLPKGLTCFIGANGAGKTALMLALLRMFGISAEERRIRRRDFHVPVDETEPPLERKLSIEVILAFPELIENPDEEIDTVPQFFQQMAADDHGCLKCRLRLDATWTNDGSIDGVIEDKLHAIRTLAPSFTDDDRTPLKSGDRSRIQMIYVPAMRDASAHVTAFLRSRLWRAIAWSESLQKTLTGAGTTLNEAFSNEDAVSKIIYALTERWSEVHDAGINAAPVFQPIDLRLQEFIRKVELVFRPDEEGRNTNVEELSDGQRSLLQIAMTAAILDVESQIRHEPSALPINMGNVVLPALTLLAVEEPENNLAPFYLSRILGQIQNLVARGTAQALVSSHSASIVARVSPRDVRYFKLEPQSRAVSVKEIPLPKGDLEAEKYVREAVRSYPELYFARFVILGEGSSEEVVLPRIAEAMQLAIDPSFVAIVPLGGRHVNHLWKLLHDLDIPYATLLDLDYGRAGGGWTRIKYACEQLIQVGMSTITLLGRSHVFDSDELDYAPVISWVRYLRQYGIFFCEPLDLDMTMLIDFFQYYARLDKGDLGPRQTSDGREAVLGGSGLFDAYDSEWDNAFRWYRYLFLGRGKPSTHVHALSGLDDSELVKRIPEPLDALLKFVMAQLRD